MSKTTKRDFTSYLENLKSEFFKTDFNLYRTLSLMRKSKTALYKANNYEEILTSLRNNVFSYGNLKLDKSIAIFSLMPVITCLDCKDCEDYCYAKKSVNQYKNAFNKALILSYMAKNQLADLEFLITNNLKNIVKHRKNVKAIRIHEKGDFINQEYVNMWIRISELFPHFKFYFYTKTDKFFDFSQKPNNMNMVNSKLPNGQNNVFDTEEEVIKISKLLNIPYCKYGFMGKNGKKITPICGKCQICLNNEYVIFLKH